MKILKYILLGILALVVIFLLIAAFGPKKFKAERSIVINSPHNVVFSQVSTLRNMHEWSPWAEKDPDIKVEFGGADGEAGSTYKWEGNDKVGSGSQTLTSIEPDRVLSELNFIKPMQGKALSYINLADEAGGTKVTWGFEEDMSFPMNGLMVIMPMDKMIGDEFTRGLDKLKIRCESMKEEPSANTYNIEEVDREARHYVGKRETVSFKEIANFYGTNFQAIGEALGKQKAEMAGPPSGIFYKWDEASMKADMVAAVPVKDAATKVKGFETISIAAGKALHVEYHGAYDKSERAHRAINKYMEDKGLKNGEVVEEYVTDPMTEKDTAKWVTQIYYMIR